jgi:hypothetical protein
MTFYKTDAFYRLMDTKSDESRLCRDITWGYLRLDTSKINYLDIEGGMLTYLPAGRTQEVLPDGSWSPKGRQTGKPAKVIRQMLTDETRGAYTDADFEAFANAIKSSDVTNKADWVVVKGASIKRYYNGDHYYARQGSLSSSCMRYDECRDYFGIYTENQDIVKMLILRGKTTDKIYGRALVWHIPGFETPIMDRIYGTDSTIAAFRAEARKRGWIHRAYNSYERETFFVTPGGETIHLALKVALPKYQHARYPYLDTCKYFNYRDGTFSNVETFGRYDYCLDSTGGAGAPYWEHVYPNENAGLVSEVWKLHDRHGSPGEGRSELLGRTQLAPEPEPVAENPYFAPVDHTSYAFGTDPNRESFTGTYSEVMAMAAMHANPDVRYNDNGTWTYTWPLETTPMFSFDEVDDEDSFTWAAQAAASLASIEELLTADF